MGAWGEKLFSDDTAADIRDSFREELRRSGSPDAATDAVLAEYAEFLSDSDEAPVLWLALAVTQHKLGYTIDRVLTEARRVLDSRLGLRLWEEQGPAALRARLKEYDRIRALLDSPRPEPRPVKIKQVRFDDSGFRAGDIVGVPIAATDSTEPSHAFLKILRIERQRDAALPIAVLLDHPPSAQDPPKGVGCPTIAVRNLGGLDPNVRFKTIELRRWRGRGSPWKSVQLAGRVAVTPEEDALAHKHPLQCEWARLPELIRYSLDMTEWLTDESLERRFREMPPEQIPAIADEVLAELAKPLRSIILIGAPARRLAESGDYERALPVIEIAIRADPKSWEFHARRGQILQGLGRSAEAEKDWSYALSLAAATRNKIAMERAAETVARYRRESAGG